MLQYTQKQIISIFKTSNLSEYKNYRNFSTIVSSLLRREIKLINFTKNFKKTHDDEEMEIDLVKKFKEQENKKEKIITYKNTDFMWFRGYVPSYIYSCGEIPLYEKLEECTYNEGKHPLNIREIMTPLMINYINIFNKKFLPEYAAPLPLHIPTT